ncbi:MAG TPA: tetratricopeptide repeat protein [Kofleriaceae bacterium]|nr:tetratricopeptide repeat protein [Kofleriaceae bacterium]
MRRALILLCLFAATAVASPKDDLDRARSDFRKHDYESAMKELNVLLYPREQLALPGDLIEAREMLGACYLEAGRTEDAKAEFDKALQIDPATTLDPSFFTTGAQHLFDQAKSDLEAKRAKEAELRKLQEERERLQKIRENLVLVEHHRYAYNFFPPLGQFQNGDTTKGYLFAAGEGLTLGGSVGIWLYLVRKYGVNCPHCVALDDAGTVLHLQEAEIGLGVAFIGLYVYGVIDAVRHYKAQVQLDEDSLPPELLRDLDKGRKKQPTSFLHRINIGPMATSNGIGIGIGWEN